MKRAGSVWLDALLVLVTVAAVSAVAVPKVEDLKRRQVAARLLADVEAVRAATYAFYSDSGYFPRGGGGAIPESLERYLPAGFLRTRRAWTVGFEHWTNRTSSIRVKTKQQIGVSVTTTDGKLGATAMEMYGFNPKYSMGRRYVFVIVGL